MFPKSRESCSLLDAQHLRVRNFDYLMNVNRIVPWVLV